MSVGSIGWRGAYNAAKGYAKRAGNMYADFVFGTGNNAFSKAMKETIKNRATSGDSYFRAIGNGFKNGIHAAEKNNALMKSKSGGFWKNMGKNLKEFFPQIGRGWKIGGQRAASLGKNVTWGKFKGALKGAGTKMPLIGSLLLVAFEIPNIFKATKNEGLVSGAAEAVKAGARIGGATLGAAIGTACLGPIGGIAGWMLGDWLTGKIVGKSYSERQAETAAKATEAQQTQPQGQTDPTLAGFNPTMTEADFLKLQEALYGGKGNIFEQDFYGTPQFNQMG